jgi:hypothetical protein
MLPSSTSMRLLIFFALPGPDTERSEPTKGARMDIVHDRCAGLDVSKRDAKVCVRTQEPDKARAKTQVTTWPAVTN